MNQISNNSPFLTSLFFVLLFLIPQCKKDEMEEAREDYKGTYKIISIEYTEYDPQGNVIVYDDFDYEECLNNNCRHEHINVEDGAPCLSFETFDDLNLVLSPDEDDILLEIHFSASLQCHSHLFAYFVNRGCAVNNHDHYSIWWDADCDQQRILLYSLAPKRIHKHINYEKKKDHVIWTYIETRDSPIVEQTTISFMERIELKKL